MISGSDTRKLLGITDRTLARWFEGGLRVEKREGASGRKPQIRMLDLLKWVYDRGGADPDLSAGGTSVNLEKYRAEKARAAKRENGIAEGKLVEIAEVIRIEGEIFSALKTELEAVTRLQGPESVRLIQEAIARAEASGKKAGIA